MKRDSLRSYRKPFVLMSVLLLLLGSIVNPFISMADAETEPNDKLGLATVLPLNADITGTFAAAWDVDWYRITFPDAGRVTLSFFTPPDIRPRLEIYNRNADYTWESKYAINDHDNIFLTYDVLEAGTYFIRVNDQDGDTSTTPYTLRAEFTALRDVQEPNNEPGRAFLLTGQTVSGHIFGRYDEDWFKIYVNSGDKLSLAVTAPAQMSTYLELYGPNMEYLWVRGGAVNPGDKVYLDHTPAVSGYCYIRITDQQGQGHALPYSMTVSGGRPGYIPPQTPATVETEPNDALSQATPVSAGNSVTGALAQAGDQDWYRFPISQRGQLTVKLEQAPAQLQLRAHLYNSSAGTIHYGQATDLGKLFSMTYDVTAPGDYYLMFSSLDGNVFSAESYAFSLSFVEVNDPYESNNDYGDTKPLSQLNRVEAYLFPAGDYDWYRVQVSKPGDLTATLSNLPQNITPEIAIYNMSKEYVAGQSGTSGMDLELVYPVAETGTYLVRVHAQGNDESTKPYVLTINGADFTSFAPLAQIDQINPGSIILGDALSFKGSGTDMDGTIASYSWRSSLQGALNNQAEFSTNSLVLGTHTIYFRVQDNSGIWSTEVSEVVYVGSSVTDEAEPNSPIGLANEVALDRPVKAKIDQAYDEDYFKVYVDRPGRLTATATNVPNNLRLYLEFFNRHLDYLWVRQGAAADGDSVTVSLDVTEKGWYYLRVSDWDGHFNADFTYTLTLQETPVVDPQEPNNGIINATLLTAGTVQGYIFPQYDEDWYKVWVSKDSILTVNVTNTPTNIQPYLELFDRNRNYLWVRKAASNAGDVLELVSPPFTEAGFVYIRVSDYAGQANGQQMYQLSVSGAQPGYVPTETPLPAEYEGNNTIADANLLAFNAPVTGAIGVPGDADWYKFALSVPGVIHTSLTNVPANLRLRVRLFRDDVGQIDYREATNPGDGLTFDTIIAGPGIYYVVIDTPAWDAVSAQPYSLLLSLKTAADDFEPNSRFGDAAVLKDRNRIQGLIFERGDEDWYRVTSDAGGALTVTVADVPTEIRPQIDIFDLSLQHLASKFATNKGQGLMLTLDITRMGDYLIRIKDVNSEGFSTNPYSLIITGARFNSYVPLAFIDSLSPNPVLQGAAVTLQGHGEDKDGGIIGYEWRSSLVEGVISNAAVAVLDNLPKGAQSITFKVKDNDQNWSSATSSILYVGVSAPQEEEPNNDLGSANLLGFDIPYAANIDPVWEGDFYKVQVPGAGVLTIATANPTGSLIRPYLEMYTPDMDYAWVRAGAANAGDPVSLEWRLTEAGWYYLRVSDSDGKAGPYTVTASFQPAGDPFEPNGDFAQAAVLQPQDTVQGFIFPENDQDWFKITFTKPGMLTMDLTNMPANLRGYVETWGRNLEYVWERTGANNDGDNVSLNYAVAVPGTYYFRITDSDGHYNAASPYTLTTRFVPAPDAYEPNSDFRTATRLTASPVDAYLFPQYDTDWYKFYAKVGESLTFTVDPVPAALRPYLELFDANYGYLWVRTAADAAGQPVTLNYDVPAAGYYYLKITDYNSQFTAAATYRLSVGGTDLSYAPSEATVTAETEPNNNFAAATRIGLGNISGSFGVQEDVDWYKFDVAQRGILTLSLTVPAGIASEMRLYDGNFSERASRYAENKGDFSQFTFNVVEPGQWYLWLHARDGASAVENYTLQVAFAPEEDVFELNPDFARAAPITFGQTLQAQLFPQGNRDWFRINVEKPGLVRLSLGQVPTGMQAGLRIFDRNYSQQFGKENLNGGDPLLAEFVAVAPGLYYVEIYDRDNNASSLSPYTLTVAFTAKDDLLEPDNRFSQAVLLADSNQVQGLIYPGNDPDWYKFYVDKPGLVRVQIAEAEGIQPRLRLFSDSKNQLAEMWAKNKGDELRLTFDITQPDWYYVLVNDQNEDNLSLRSYVLTVEGGQFTANYPLAHIDSILPDPVVQGSPVIFSGSGTDVDGTIISYEWTSSISGKLGNDKVVNRTDLPVGSHRISLRVQDNEGRWSGTVYKNLYVVENLAAEAEYNNSRETANPVLLNQWISSAVYPRYDEDYFKLFVPQRGYLSASIDALAPDLKPYLEFYGEQGNYLWQRDGVYNPGDSLFYGFFAEPGWYYARITDERAGEQRKPYALRFDFAAAPDRYEPNNSASRATWLNRVGVIADAVISKVYDEDWYRIQIDQRGRLSLSLTQSPADMKGYLELFNANLDYLWVRNGAWNDGEDVFLDFDALIPGIYYLRITDSNARAHTQPYRLTSTFTAVPDSGGQNSNIASAVLVPQSGVVDATIFPANDENWYKVYAPANATLQIALTNVPAGMRAGIETWDRNLNYTWERQFASNNGDNLYLSYTVPSDGMYYIRVNDQNGGAYLTPYRLSITGGTPGYEPAFNPVTTETEPNGDSGMATDIPLGTTVTGTIDPADDYDWYRFYVNSPGILTLSHTAIPAGITSEMWVFNGNKDQIGYRTTTNAGEDNVLVLPVTTGGYYYVRLADYGRDNSSTSAYALRAAFTPAVDAREVNNNFGAATPLGADTVQGLIFNSQDEDWYRFYVRQPGMLALSLEAMPAEVRPHIELYNADKSWLAGWTATNPGQTGADLVTFNAVDPGFYYARIFDEEWNTFSATPYTLRVTGADFSHAPLLDPLGDRTIDETIPYGFTVHATDPLDESSLTYGASNLPPGATFDPQSHTFSWTPGRGQAGAYAGVQFTASDGVSQDSQAITITVRGVDRPPVLYPIGPKTAVAGTELAFTVTAADPDAGAVLTYGAGNLPNGAVFTPATATFSWIPARSQIGLHKNVKFEVTDGQWTDFAYIDIEVRAPELKGDLDGDKAVDLGDAILGLRILSGFALPQGVQMAGDLNRDGVIGMPEAVYILQYLAGLREVTFVPNPPHGATNVAAGSLLGWSVFTEQEGIVLTYDVYFGEAATPGLVSAAQSAQTYRPTLAAGKTYYWKVVAKDSQGGEFSSPLWLFTTQGANVTALINDQFDALNTADWWLTRGSNNDRFGEGKPFDAGGVQFVNGIVSLNADVTDQVGVMYSKPFAVEKGDIVTIKRRVLVHPANRYYGGIINVYEVADPALSASKTDTFAPLFGLFYANYSYQTDLNLFSLIWAGNLPYGPGDYSGGRAPQIAPLWDQWFDEEFVYNSGTGDTVYKINGLEKMRVQASPLTEPYLKVMMHSYGWWTGHYMQMDYLIVETTKP